MRCAQRSRGDQDLALVKIPMLLISQDTISSKMITDLEGRPLLCSSESIRSLPKHSGSLFPAYRRVELE